MVEKWPKFSTIAPSCIYTDEVKPKVRIPFHLLLAPKKLSSFFSRKLLVFGIFLATLGLLSLPASAHAGFFSSLLKFISRSTPVVEEAANFLINPSQAAEAELPALQANSAAGEPGPASPSPAEVGLPMVRDSALLAPLNPLGTRPAVGGPPGGQIFIYTVRPGDTLSSIADAFDVTQNTILWANGITNARLLKVGDQILILPVSGVRHEVKSGDTVSAIAKRYRASQDDITRFNGLDPDEPLAVGSVVIVPDGELPFSAPLSGTRSLAQNFSNLPSFAGYYLRPILGGRRSRGLHGFNGVDLASSCGLPVLASAEGTVLVARASGWNGGYGRYLVISHPNGTQTLYAHLQEILAGLGQAVSQGAPIASIGSSGNSTGCHVHFEVRGAKTPF